MVTAMLYIIPDYYKSFACVADRCEDTCCAGWQIVIDDKMRKKYQNVRGEFGRRLHRSVDWKKSTFKQVEDRRCAFLNGENLCDLYTALGRESLCKTCRLYPRHIEEFEGVREITLSASCPEAARILLTKKEPVQFLKYEKEGEEELEDFDLLLYSYLVDAREVMLDILRDRRLELKVRAGLMLGIAHDMQGRVNRGELFTCQEVFEKYQTERAEAFVKEKLAEDEKRPVNRYVRSENMFRILYELEFLREDWFLLLKESENRLYRQSSYEEIVKEYEAWCRKNLPELPIVLEQLLVYFLFTYFCGAVYDGRIYAKARMAAVSVMLLGELFMARWLRNEKCLDLEDMVEIVYRYSRELEHSDENLEKFERMIMKQEKPASH